jgi:hypothetical protein
VYAISKHRARAAKVCGHGRGIERGGHHYQSQIGTAGELQTAEQRQCQVALQVAFVKLVEHHAACAFEVGVGKQAPGEHPFGEESQARGRAGDLFEADLVTHRAAHALAAFRRDVARGQACGQAARFEHQHLAIVEREDRRRNAGSLPRPRFGFQHQVVGGAQVFEDAGNQRIDGQAHGN